MEEAGSRLIAPRAEHEPAILALNGANEIETAPLTPALWRSLTASAFRVRAHAAGGEIAAFLLALDENSPCDGPNFSWFRARYPRFVYIDRVIVAEAWRGRGLARALYQDLLDAGRAASQTVLCCEVNLVPPNRPSDAFHASLGFSEVGRAEQPERGKTVRYLTRAI